LLTLDLHQERQNIPAELLVNPYWHRNGLAHTNSMLARPAWLAMWASWCWHGTDIWMDNGTERLKQCTHCKLCCKQPSGHTDSAGQQGAGVLSQSLDIYGVGEL